MQHKQTAAAGFSFVDQDEVAERRARQGGGTVYQQLLAQGFTPEGIAAEATGYERTRRINLFAVAQDGSDVPLIGVAYGGDFRTEEEVGIPQIGKALRTGLHAERVFTGEIDGVWYLGIHADGGAQEWRGQDHVDKVAATALARSRDTAQFAHHADRHLKVAELRKNLRDAGVTGPLPRTKAELLDLHAEHIHGGWKLANIGEFHDGATLIMIPARPVIEAALRILAGAGEHLRMVGSSSPFPAGAVLMDDRDYTPEHIENVRAHQDYTARMNVLAEPTRALLRQKGQLFALSPGRNRDGVDVFWLNYSPHGFPQVYGWFTLDELHRRHREGDWSLRRR